MIKYNAIILKNECISKNIYELVLESKIQGKPGQFVNIEIGSADMLLRRPIAISDSSSNKIVLTYKIMGEGTKKISNKSVGESINILGPLGNGFPLFEYRKVLLVGGGMGIAPLVSLAKKLSKTNEVSIVLGCIDETAIFYKDKLSEYGTIHIATMDGTCGYHGNIIDFLDYKKLDFDVIYACGPFGLLKAIDQKYFPQKEGYLSLEERMACGVGVCYGCTVKTQFGNARVCKDGPVFPLGVIKYD